MSLTHCAWLTCVVIAVTAASSHADDPKSTLDRSYRAFYEARKSEKKEDREKAWKAVLPEKADIEILFPKHLSKLWPVYEQSNAFVLNNSDKFAAEFRKKKADFVRLDLTDIRKSPDPEQKRLLEMIPKDIPIYDYVEKRSDGGFSGGGQIVYVRNRWLFMPGLSSASRMIEQGK